MKNGGIKMNLRKWPTLFVVVLMLSAGCGTVIPETIVSGSGKAETKDFSLSGFSSIQAAAAFSVQASQSDAYKVTVTADDNLWADLDVSVSGGSLHLQSKPGVSFRNTTLKAVVTMPALRSLDFSGAALGAVKGFKSDSQLTVRLSGAGTMNLDGITSGSTTFDISGAGSVTGSATTGDVKFTVSGAGRVNLSGAGTTASIDASGASHVTLDRFSVQKVSAVVSGASEARVNAQNITSADISGASHLYYVGSPTLGKINTTGGSSVSKE
jgi:hypothetical protein